MKRCPRRVEKNISCKGISVLWCCSRGVGRWYPYKTHGWEGLKSWSPNSRIQWVRNGPSLLEIDYYNRRPESE